MEIELTVNGAGERIEVPEGTDLATALRSAGYNGVRCGCDGGDCGVSTVLIEGDPVMACDVDAGEVDGATVETIEGLGSQDDLHPIQQAFVDHFAVQCGYCTPAFILEAKALLAAEPDPSERQVREAIDDVICRCTGYQKPVEAILAAAAEMNDETAVAADGGRATRDGDGPDGCGPNCCEVDGDE